MRGREKKQRKDRRTGERIGLWRGARGRSETPCRHGITANVALRKHD